jgi:hypothetical protein
MKVYFFSQPSKIPQNLALAFLSKAIFWPKKFLLTVPSAESVLTSHLLGAGLFHHST